MSARGFGVASVLQLSSENGATAAACLAHCLHQACSNLLSCNGALRPVLCRPRKHTAGLCRRYCRLGCLTTARSGKQSARKQSNALGCCPRGKVNAAAKKSKTRAAPFWSSAAATQHLSCCLVASSATVQHPTCSTLKLRAAAKQLPGVRRARLDPGCVLWAHAAWVGCGACGGVAQHGAAR